MQAPSPFDWLIQHLQLLGWPSVVSIAVYGTYKFVRFLDNVFGRLTAAERNLDLLANNHFSHIEESLGSIAGTFERLEPLVTDMNTNIRILLDREDYRDISKKHTEE